LRIADLEIRGQIKLFVIGYLLLDLIAEVGMQRTEVRSQRFSIADFGMRIADLEIRGQRSEDRRQKSEVRGQRLEGIRQIIRHQIVLLNTPCPMRPALCPHSTSGIEHPGSRNQDRVSKIQHRVPRNHLSALDLWDRLVRSQIFRTLRIFLTVGWAVPTKYC